MTKDKHTTEVIFRVDTTKEFYGTVFAIFPYMIADYKGNVTTYQHVGQHSSGGYKICLQTSRKANSVELKDLKSELTNSVGYNLKVITRRNSAKYLRAYRESRK